MFAVTKRIERVRRPKVVDACKTTGETRLGCRTFPDIIAQAHLVNAFSGIHQVCRGVGRSRLATRSHHIAELRQVLPGHTVQLMQGFLASSTKDVQVPTLIRRTLLFLGDSAIMLVLTD